MAESLQPIRDALEELIATVTEELDQIAQQPTVDPAQVQRLADSIRAQGERIKGMVPDAPPAPGA